ncbi:MAG: cupin domain-containing protein [Caldilineaceae bacterium]
MSFQIYDYRTTNRNVLVTPEIRARLYHMKPGQVDSWHSHDLGHEVFLILEGQAEFNIDHTKQILGPGQMCIARADEIHQVRNMLPDQETVMYLSVTPHVQPTHTGRTDADEKMPPNFTPNANYNDPTDMRIPVADLLARHLDAADQMVETARSFAVTQHEMADALHKARAAGDMAAAEQARNAMWDAVYLLHKQLYALDRVWNELAPRATEAADAPQTAMKASSNFDLVPGAAEELITPAKGAPNFELTERETKK